MQTSFRDYQAPVAAFTAVDELEGAARAVGWDIDYRQMARGPSSAYFASLDGAGIRLASELCDNDLHVLSTPPEGYIGVFLLSYPAGCAAACGRPLVDSDLIFVPAGSQIECRTQGEVRNETAWVPEADFVTAVRSLLRSDAWFPRRSASVYGGDGRSLEAIRRDLQLLFRLGDHCSESSSNLLARMIFWMADASSCLDAECLGHGARTAIARRAQAFIEEHFRDPVHLSDLCAFTGVGLRTLQRCFAAHQQVSVTDYLKARRLHGARRDLTALEPNGKTVAEIALSNGFSHLGRFSAQYRLQFGESPSATLQRVRSSV